MSNPSKHSPNETANPSGHIINKPQAEPPALDQFCSRIQNWDEAWLQISELANLNLSEVQKKAIINFQEFLHSENQKINLTRLSELSDFLTFHLLDTASLYRDYIKLAKPNQPLKYIDLGSGCGVPGILLHILLAEELPKNQITLETTLCDSIQKKVNFLNNAIQTCLAELPKPANIKAVCCRTEHLIAQKHKYNLITARAMAKPLQALGQAASLLAPNAFYLAQSSFSLQNTDEKPESTDLIFEIKKLTNPRKISIESESAFLLAEKARYITAFKKNS